MADYDSDSSSADEVETNVLLGYASKEPTSDNVSQLGGHPTWLDEKSTPNGSLATCKVCNGSMSLLLQLYADLPERFPGHERRLYVWTCRRKACRRKEGSTRSFRATRVNSAAADPTSTDKQARTGPSPPADPTKSPVNLGETLFGVKSPTTTAANPFSTSSSSSGTGSNPFARTSTLAAKPAQPPAVNASLSETFAQKARISSPPAKAPEQPPSGPQDPWPNRSSFPQPYLSYHVDADKEYLEAESQSVPANARLDRSASNGEGGSSAADDKAAFESSMDKTFQRFADRLAQNPEQVLRYEFEGQPLLYSKTDAVGKLFAPAMEHAHAKLQTTAGGRGGLKIPSCTNCGSGRVFELQLTPHAITELEADEMSIDGMDWGTVILGVCSADCQEPGKNEGEVGYVEEWVGVQWEEIAGKGRH